MTMLFWKSNPEIALTVLYVDADVKIFCVKDEICPHVCINQPNSRIYLNITMKEKKQFCY